ncbi:MAG: universal stress protein [Ferruginibacter sp.]
MQKLFNKILVPVDFSSKSKNAVEKAVEIARQYDCSIYLLHVADLAPFALVASGGWSSTMPFQSIDNKSELELKLDNLLNYIHLISADPISVDYKILYGTWDEAIIDFVNQNSFDLVLIGQKRNIIGNRNMLVDPNKVAAKTNIAVITVPDNRRLTRLYSIVIPITDFLPVRKLMYGVYIASVFETTIKLLGIENKKTKDKVQYYIEKAYRLITDNCSVKVEPEIIVSQNVAEAVNQFAMMKYADLVILNPGTETKMPGFFSALLGNIIQKYATPPVLTVNPV